MKALRAAGLAVTAGLMTVAAFHAGIGDFLLFKSDLASLGRYFSAASAMAALPYAALFGVLALVLPRSRPLLHRWSIVLLLAALSFGFAVSVIWGLTHWFNIGLFLGRFVDLGNVHAFKVWILAVMPPVAVIALIVVLWAMARAVRKDPSLIDRMEALGQVVAAALILAAAGSFFPSTPPAGPAGASRANVVMIVVDRLPAWALPAYAPKSPVQAFDELSARAKVFKGVYTSLPFTNGYFGALYSGRLPGDQGQGNLIGRLQDAGVAVRLVNSHRSAVPESSDAQVSGYKGLRSRLLGPRSIQVPRWLGLDYHFSIAPPGAYEGRLLSKLWTTLNPASPGGNPLTRELPAIISRLSKDNRPAFVLLHVNLSDFAAAGETGSPQFIAGDGASLKERIKDNEYRYAPSDAADKLAKHLRDVVYAQTAAFAGILKSALADLRSMPGFEDALVVVTADHGTMYGGGRFWYGYHPTKEVLNVPFLVFGAGDTSHDTRVFSTLDVSRTILDHFRAGGGDLSADSHSLFQEGAANHAASLTMRADKHREWVLSIHHEHGARRYNLHPDAAWRTEAVTFEGFDETPMAVSPDDAADIARRAAGWARRFGLTETEISAAGLE